jgi:aspartate racemase
MPKGERSELTRSSRVPGIIGGAGPGATARLYLDVIERCRRAGLPWRPPVLIASLEIDLACEARLLETGDGIEGYHQALLRAGRALAAAGADFLALPCNTLHLLAADLQAAVPLPVLSILEAVARQAAEAECRIVGLLSTRRTARSGVYTTGLRNRGIEVVCLASDLQARLDERIRAELDTPGQVGDAELCAAIMSAFAAQGVCAIVAGCTELKAVMADWRLPVPVIDSLDALGAAVAQEIVAGWSG